MAGRIPRKTIVVLMPVIFWSGPGSATIIDNELVVLGDSLSNQGNVYSITGTPIPPPQYTESTNSERFTNGLDCVDYLAPSLGVAGLGFAWHKP